MALFSRMISIYVHHHQVRCGSTCCYSTLHLCLTYNFIHVHCTFYLSTSGYYDMLNDMYIHFVRNWIANHAFTMTIQRQGASVLNQHMSSCQQTILKTLNALFWPFFQSLFICDNWYFLWVWKTRFFCVILYTKTLRHNYDDDDKGSVYDMLST